MRVQKKIFIFLLFFFSYTICAISDVPINLDESKAYIDRFRVDPKSIIDSPIQKYDESGKKIKRIFDKNQFAYIYTDGENTMALENFKLSEKYVDEVKKERLKRQKGLKQSDLKHVKGGKRPANNNPREIIGDDNYSTNLHELPMQGSLDKKPWSGDFWAVKYGGISKRYSWPSYYDAIKYSNTWKSAIGCYNQPDEFITKKNALDFDSFVANHYSPAEKYDLLVGDEKFTLTNAAKEDGKKYIKDGDVEGWMGICHGWAPASYASPRPVKSITVKAKDGTNITFYQDDLRALISQKWAKTYKSEFFLGGRCNVKSAEITKDELTGSIIDDRCFDVNPANWHIAVTNLIGKRARSFIIDATFDYEVWNQPLYSYLVSFFNPRSGEFSNDINKSREPVGDWDLFSRVTDSLLKRSEGAKYIIGVVMQIAYIAEANPSHYNKPYDDKIVVAKYIYDLGLNEDNEIVGEGEWWQNGHPDFLWTPADYTIPSNKADRVLDNLNFKYNPAELTQSDELSQLSVIMIPGTNTNVIEHSSSEIGGASPLRAVIDGLLNLSKEE